MRAGVLSRGLGTGPQKEPAAPRWGGVARPTSGDLALTVGLGGTCLLRAPDMPAERLQRSTAPRGPQRTAPAQPLDPQGTQAPRESRRASPRTGLSVPSRAWGGEASAAAVLGVGGAMARVEHSPLPSPG